MELNELESLFVRAFVDPGIRPAFYRRLMHSDVFVFAIEQPGTSAPTVISFLRDDGAKVAPVFTSEHALSLNAPVLWNDPCIPRVLRLPTRKLMEQTRGLYLHINPWSEFNRDFSPEEIEYLLKDETIHFGMRAVDILPQGLDIQLAALDVPMPALEKALTRVFADAPEVECAFLVEVERIHEDKLVRTVVMVAEAKPSKTLTNAVSTIFSDMYSGALPVDLCFDEGDKTFVKTLKQIGARPFFTRSDATGNTEARFQ